MQPRVCRCVCIRAAPCSHRSLLTCPIEQRHVRTRHRLTSGSRWLDGTPFEGDATAVFSTLLNTAALTSSTAGNGRTHDGDAAHRHYAHAGARTFATPASDFLFDDKKATFAVYAVPARSPPIQWKITQGEGTQCVGNHGSNNVRSAFRARICIASLRLCPWAKRNEQNECTFEAVPKPFPLLPTESSQSALAYVLLRATRRGRRWKKRGKKKEERSASLDEVKQNRRAEEKKMCAVITPRKTRAGGARNDPTLTQPGVSTRSVDTKKRRKAGKRRARSDKRTMIAGEEVTLMRPALTRDSIQRSPRGEIKKEE